MSAAGKFRDGDDADREIIDFEIGILFYISPMDSAGSRSRFAIATIITMRRPLILRSVDSLHLGFLCRPGFLVRVAGIMLRQVA